MACWMGGGKARSAMLGSDEVVALGVYVAACRPAGIPVIGCAPSARARDELRLGVRVDACYTVAKLLLLLVGSKLSETAASCLTRRAWRTAAASDGCLNSPVPPGKGGAGRGHQAALVRR